MMHFSFPVFISLTKRVHFPETPEKRFPFLNRVLPGDCMATHHPEGERHALQYICEKNSVCQLFKGYQYNMDLC